MARRRGGLFVGASECEEILGIGRDTRRRWEKRGLIPRYVDPDTGVVHYPRPQLEQLAAELRTNAAQPAPTPRSPRRLRRAPNPDVPEPLELPKETAS